MESARSTNTPTPASSTSRSPSQSIPVPTSSRIRNPPPPSPLSQINSPVSDAEHHHPPSPGISLSPPATIPEPLTSPCYIHSYLDKHGNGTLADYLNHHGHGHGHGSPSHAHGQTSSPARRSAHGMNGLGAAMDTLNMTDSAGANGPAGRSSAMPGSGGDAHGQPERSSSRDHVVKHSARHTARFQPHHLPDHQHGQGPNGPHSQGGRSGSDSRPMSRSVSGGSEYGGSDRSGLNAMSNSVLEGDFDEDGGSLTKQLAETAQGVREMSRELGRTLVKSRIQSVLIVTKARDNRLIKLTRELAVYLMSKRSSSSSPSDRPPSSASTASTATAHTDRGLIVYVDAQLRKSKRFNAAGIKEEHPEFFRPTVRRRSSSSTSISTLSAAPSSSSLGDLHRKRNGDDGQLRYWTGEMCSSSPHLFDFVITLGGDGTVLFTSWLFQKIVPPVLPFALGSLGFLTNFDFANYRQTMDRVIDSGIRVNLRMRFTCTVYRAVAPDEADCANMGVCATGGKTSNGRRKAIRKPDGEILMSQVDRAGWEALEGGPPRLKAAQNNRRQSQSTTDDSEYEKEKERDKEIMCFTTRPVEQFEVLNDLVVDRGPSPYVSLLEIFGDEHHLTTVQADGLTVSTPTGSTAYSLSAGGSLVHPQIPAILLTPICPHTLSFRPMLLPDGMELRICVPYNSRSTAWASFDGRGRVELKQGDHIKVTASKYPFPTVSADKASTDWFSSVSRTLRWNEREKQKSFVVVEEDAPNRNQAQGKSGKARESTEGDADNDRERRADGSADGHAPRQPDMSGERRERSKNKAEAGMEDPGSEEAHRDVEQDEEEEEDEEYDIDDKSGEATPDSPGSPDQTPKHGQSYEPASDLLSRSSTSPSNPNQNTSPRSRTNPNLPQRSPTESKSGVNTPDRFVTHHTGPPPLSQRHLIDKLHQAELKEKENERGQRDEIRSDPNVMRTGSHMLPGSSRSSTTANTGERGERGDSGRGRADGQRHKRTHSSTSAQASGNARREASAGRHEGRAKAFAFFGQDDSASDMSDDLAD